MQSYGHRTWVPVSAGLASLSRAGLGCLASEAPEGQGGSGSPWGGGGQDHHQGLPSPDLRWSPDALWVMLGVMRGPECLKRCRGCSPVPSPSRFLMLGSFALQCRSRRLLPAPWRSRSSTAILCHTCGNVCRGEVPSGRASTSTSSASSAKVSGPAWLHRGARRSPAWAWRSPASRLPCWAPQCPRKLTRSGLLRTLIPTLHIPT